MFLPARRTVLLFTVAVLCAGIVPAGADEPGAEEPGAKEPGADAPATDAARRARRPGQFFSILTFGYGGDDFPDDAALFETIVRRAREEGRFNAVMCSWSEERAAICRRHGMRIMVDLLNARHHVYKGPDEARALLERLRGDDVVMGHHLWSDEFGKQAEGRIRDLRACNAWDPTHPAYVATRKTGGLAVAAQADIFGWYDFHWKRSGWNRHFAALQVALPLARRHDSIFYSLLATDSGLPGRGNYNRSLWSVNQGVAFGMKGVVWFIGSRQMDVGSGAWTEIGRDINKVNAQVMPLAEELMRVGNPVAVYATPITRDANDREVAGGPRLLDELAGHAFPPDFWIQPAAGEFTMGVFALEGGRAAVYVANFNAYAGQEIALALGRAVAVERFDRARGEWVGLPVKEGRITFALGPAEGELLRFE